MRRSQTNNRNSGVIYQQIHPTMIDEDQCETCYVWPMFWRIEQRAPAQYYRVCTFCDKNNWIWINNKRNEIVDLRSENGKGVKLMAFTAKAIERNHFIGDRKWILLWENDTGSGELTCVFHEVNYSIECIWMQTCKHSTSESLTESNHSVADIL